MTVQCPALFIAAPASGQGKTTVTAGLARLHRRLGRRVRIFKTGPDFLDPMTLARAAGAPVYNLDLWMGGEDHCRALLHRAAREVDLILVEGVMGLYDGQPSGADLAERFGLPLLCVIDAAAMAQTFAALAWGLTSFRPGLRLAGVLANRVGSARHATMLTERLPAEIPFLGALSRDAGLELPHRHLGLWQAAEIADLDARLERIADALATTPLGSLPAPVTFGPAAIQRVVATGLAGVRIGVAQDLAFSFLYAANLDTLRAAGAELRFFSPLDDRELPPCDALYLPGGYPELYLDRLAANTAMKDAIRAHQAAGRPILAECGGLLYLLDSLAAADGDPVPMVGLLPGRARMQTRLANLGLQRVTLPEGELRGHCFHHSSAEIDLEPIARAAPLHERGAPEPVYRLGRLTASYLHLYFPSNPNAAIRLFIRLSCEIPV
ncbi:cobyrinate a,c-diamide synthase [uncultured Thiodictyon sp.]|uniref:cobyrinate a,c-diamide synthase n=1 Tax=uncultured Thiodictyon sp. TaxID=1846217 RepID=UPI0025E5BD15|nr:cobyrinate a,c-diamide synthase [uncultured Thiodictyon sp.]